MIVRREVQADHEAVYRVVREAFLAAERTDGTEQDLVAALRRSEAFVPELSLVADEGGVIVGHVLLTRARVGKALFPRSRWRRFRCCRPFSGKGLGQRLCAKGIALPVRLGMRDRSCWGMPGITRGSGMRQRSASESRPLLRCRARTSWRVAFAKMLLPCREW